MPKKRIGDNGGKPCHNEVMEDGESVFIPGCMGAAVYGKHRCTCRLVEFDPDVDHLAKMVERLAKRVESLERKVRATK